MRHCSMISCSVVGWTWLKPPSMSWVSTASCSGNLFEAFFWLIALAIGLIDRRRASIAEFSACAPICDGCVAPHICAACTSHFAVIDSSSLPKHDRSEIGRYDLGCQ